MKELEGLTHTEGMREKRQIFVETGRRGGSAKVPKGVAVLSPEERKERARQAAIARWSQKKSQIPLASTSTLTA